MVGQVLLVLWPFIRSVTFRNLCGLYCHYVTKKYHRVTVVFDGYSINLSTKQMVQHRRSSGKIGATVTFTPYMTVNQKKDVFLFNTKNKERFLAMLSESLCQHQCETHHVDGDADLLIVKTPTSPREIKSPYLLGTTLTC